MGATGRFRAGATCAVEVGNLLAYRDDNHLTTYTTWLSPLLGAELDETLHGPVGELIGQPLAASPPSVVASLKPESAPSGSLPTPVRSSASPSVSR